MENNILFICSYCGNKVTDEDDFCRDCGNKILKDIFETEIYVPIDFSNTMNIVPVGEDIIYSTLCKVNIRQTTKDVSFLSHVLMTSKGFAYTRQYGWTRDPELYYYPWHVIKPQIFGKKSFRIGLAAYNFICKREPNYETKENYKKRISRFPFKMYSIMLGANKEKLKELRAKPQLDKEEQKQERKLVSLIKTLEARKNSEIQKLKKKAIKAEKKKQKQ